MNCNRSPGLLALSLLACVVSAAPGSAEAGDWSIGFGAGPYAPDPDILEDDATLGVRVGHMVTGSFTMEGSLFYTELDFDLAGHGLGGDLTSELWFIDVTLGYLAFDDRRFNLLVGGGPGYAFSETTGTASGPDGALVRFEGLEDDSFTLHFVVGGQVAFGDRWHLRVSPRIRWITDREDSDYDVFDVDLPLTIGFVW